MLNRRTLLKSAAGLLPAAAAWGAPDWKKQIGLELYTVRDLLAKDFEGTIAKVAELGYREVEPIGYGGLEPKAFRALLDKYKLTCPSTHGSATEGPDLEKELEGHRTMGIRYTEVRAARPAGATPQRPPRTEETFKKAAAKLNQHGSAARKFDMKVLYHNHAFEFDTLEGSTLTQYDVLLKETDPDLVTFQLDIAWAAIAGRNAIELFNAHPGRFELWHVKDVAGLKAIDQSAPPSKRRAKFIPIGQGDIDYKPIFKAAKKAGLKYYVIEQDNAAEGGADSMAAAKANIEGLRKVLG
jgi:sugar phosphate isomerase/epimerase